MATPLWDQSRLIVQWLLIREVKEEIEGTKGNERRKKKRRSMSTWDRLQNYDD